MNQYHKVPSKFSRLLIVAASFAYLSSAILPAYASDTEIYTRSASAGTLSPTLMFMLDTSGSMAFCMDNDNGSGCGVNGLRKDALKNSMNDALNGSGSIPGYVNVGLSTYDSGGAGGRIRYPARPLDALIELEQDGVINVPVAYGESDAEQLPTASGVQDLVRDELAVGFKSGVQQSVGLHFDEVLVPQGAEIRSAEIRLTAKASDSSASAPFWLMSVAASDDAPNFSVVGQSVNARAYDANTQQMRPTNWSTGTVYSFDVKDQVQVIAKRSGWCGGKAMSFRIEDVTGAGTPTRRAYSYEGAVAANNLGLAPQLVISYVMDSDYFKASSPKLSCTYLPFATVNKIIDKRDDDGYWTASSSVTTSTNSIPIAQVTSGAPRFAGLRFQGIGIPRNAIIKQAALNVTANSNRAGVPPIKIEIYNDDTTPTFASSGFRPTTAPLGSILDVSTGLLVPTAFQWQPPGSSVTANVRYTIPTKAQRTGAVTTQVQAIVNRPDWDSGDALVFLLQNTTSVNNDIDIKAASSDALLATNPSLYVRGYQQNPITDLRALTTVREQLTSAVNALVFNNGTPLGRAYLESARSLMAMSKSPSGTADGGTLDGSSRYVTTVVASDTCAANYIFALTDGDPNSSNYPNDGGLDDTSAFGATACTKPVDVTLGSSYANTFKCMAGVARLLADAKGNIKTKVKTNTVILGPLAGDAAANMKGVAAAGRGKYYEARTSGALSTAIKSTIDDLLNVSGTVSAPGVAVNQLSRLSHLNQLYYSVFNPRASAAHWAGNVKRYKLDLVHARVEDSTGAAAINPDTTFFNDEAKSWWLVGTVPDGKDAAFGGAAHKLPAPDLRAGAGTARNMYSYYASYPATPASTSGQALTKVALGDTALKTAMGLSDNNIFNNLAAWLLGYLVGDITDVETYGTTSDLRNQMGGGLHSRPTLVSYGYSGTLQEAQFDADTQDNTVYFSSMEGILHAIEAKTGKEVFSFIPKELLTRIQTLYANTPQTLPEFGLDTSWTVYRKDGDGDFKISSSGAGGDKVIIYGGMRMGGSNYYALDVTNRSAPKLLFSLVGGSGSFANMGQTWAEPVISSVKINGTAKTVLVFGGGYDPKHESEGYQAGTSDADSKGNQIYIVDAFTGELYWWASNAGLGRPASGQVTEMKFSIPSAVKPLDTNDDGYADAFYVGDLGGQLFRLDVDNANTGKDTLIKRVKLFAKLGQTVLNNTANQRRIYEPPSVARLRDPVTRLPYIAVAIGTGYRSRPLDEGTTDMFYMLTDNDILRADVLTPSTALQAVITGPTNVAAPATDELAKVDLTGITGVGLSGKKGWYLPLAMTGEVGEKVLASPLIFNGEVYFTAYLPNVTVEACSPVAGASRLYRMAARDAAVVTDLNNTGGSTPLDAGDRVNNNVVLGIGGEPQIIISQNQKGVDAAGNEVVQLNCPSLPSGKKAYCDGKEVTIDSLACSSVLVGTGLSDTEYQCLSGLKRTRWFELK